MSWKDRFPKKHRYFETENGILYNWDAPTVLKTLPNSSIDCVVTSPPYWALRDYGVEGQLGLEPTFQEYLEKLWAIFDEVYRVLKPTGTCWVNLGDTYSQGKTFTNRNGLSTSKVGSVKNNKKQMVFKSQNAIKQKSLCLIPQRFSIGMVDRGWILRNDIIWEKPNALPESVRDRFTKSHEYIFFFVKNKKYYFEQQFEEYAPSSDVRYRQALRANRSYNTKAPYKNNTPYCHTKYKRGQGGIKSRGNDADGLVVGGKNSKGRNKRDVWIINTKPFKDAHFAVFPPEIPETCIKAGCPKDGIVLDPFMGSGTTAEVAERLYRKWVGIELNKEYCEIAKRRIKAVAKNKLL